MTLRKKLFLWIGGSATFALLIGLLIGSLWAAPPQDGAKAADSSGMTYLAAVLLLLFTIWAIASMASQQMTARLRSLVRRADRVAREGTLEGADDEPGHDEIAMLADSFNRIAGEWIQGEKLRNQLVSDAAHELRTPIAILRGHLETMWKGAAEIKRENLLSLLDETKRMTRLIQELQQISLAESGQLSLECSWVRFAPLIREVADIFGVEAEEKRIDLTYEDDTPQGFEVYCDAARIKQALINLIGNAIRYTPEQGAIWIRQSVAREGIVQVEVADTGPGIPAEKLPYIFHRFYRVDDSRTRTAGGTGLGLAIAKQFVETHGGTLVASSAEGKGTVFVMRLPVFPEA
ncbi:ATP-binding protein [Cohnella faecalis]|uniref:histidine kinase n=1 Tax=Cohnella faecalis TaxID=2315694 RepID=A0A398CH67_9BACL|nr:HAMP domain-containing sensor histidine kinase [Cohnella faecalis]RIE02093.1 sensor histidine kinase [Cohnella faecalis]